MQKQACATFAKFVSVVLKRDLPEQVPLCGIWGGLLLNVPERLMHLMQKERIEDFDGRVRLRG